MLHVPALLDLVEHELENAFQAIRFEGSTRFLEEMLAAHKHPVAAGGKRVRPLIVLLVAGAVGGRSAFDYALPAATSLELIHTYSLVHDDLPCMDNDSLRRGKPTTHTVYGDAKALLVGDGLLTHAFSGLCGRENHLFSDDIKWEDKQRQAVFASLSAQVLAQSAGMQGMLLGQWMDISSPNQEERSSWDFVEKVALNKTGKLLSAAFELGVLAGMVTAPREVSDLFSAGSQKLLQYAKECGLNLGIAFQVIDDLLDVTASTQTMGKTVGKDAAQDKVTAVSVLGVEGAREKANLHTAAAKQSLVKLFENAPPVVSAEALEFRTTLNIFVDSLLERKS